VIWKDGTFRKVAVTDKYAVKFARPEKNTKGYWCNREEVRIFLKVRKPFLCPVIAYDPFGRWLIARKAQVLSPNEQFARRNELFAIRREFKLFAGLELDDDKASNLGDINGRMVLIDFAGVPPDA
jgi:hypothetical protein